MITCKEKNCGFIATCPDLMACHVSMYHQKKSTPIKSSSLSERPLKPANVSDGGRKRKHIEDVEVKDIHLQKKKTSFSSPEKRPRNLRIALNNVLDGENNFNKTDKFLSDLMMKKMFKCKKHTDWSLAYNADGKEGAANKLFFFKLLGVQEQNDGDLWPLFCIIEIAKCYAIMHCVSNGVTKNSHF